RPRRTEQRKECSENQDREQEIGGGTGENDQEPLPHRPNLERAVAKLSRNGLKLSRIARRRHVADKLDVAAERQPPDFPARSLAIGPADQLVAEADRKGLGRNAEQPRY